MFEKAIETMLDYFKDEGYISHALRVFGYAQGIAAGEGIEGEEKEILLIAALFHDVGIPIGLRQEQSAAGPIQERLGAPKAMELAGPFLNSEESLARVGYLVGHHHSFQIKDDRLLQILFEADWLVNLADSGKELDKGLVYKKNFATQTGRRFFADVFADVEV